jgi:N-methylhydantoinase B
VEPPGRRGDLEAQLAAHDVCRRRAAEFFDDTGEDGFAAIAAAVHAAADRAMRRAVAAIPDGVYRSALDADGVPGQPTPAVSNALDALRLRRVRH